MELSVVQEGELAGHTGGAVVFMLVLLLWLYAAYRLWIVWAYKLNFEQVSTTYFWDCNSTQFWWQKEEEYWYKQRLSINISAWHHLLVDGPARLGLPRAVDRAVDDTEEVNTAEVSAKVVATRQEECEWEKRDCCLVGGEQSPPAAAYPCIRSWSLFWLFRVSQDSSIYKHRGYK